MDNICSKMNREGFDVFANYNEETLEYSIRVSKGDFNTIGKFSFYDIEMIKIKYENKFPGQILRNNIAYSIMIGSILEEIYDKYREKYSS